MTEPLLARIKPYNPKRGYKVRRYSVFGQRYQEGMGWYKVDPDVANYLKTVHQNNLDPESPKVFDVCTESDAKEIEQAERADKIKRGLAVAPIDMTMTTKDITAAAVKSRADASGVRSKSEQVVVDNVIDKVPPPPPRTKKKAAKKKATKKKATTRKKAATKKTRGR